MNARRIDGKKVADKILRETTEDLALLNDTVPGLGVILVGNDPASTLYVGLKKKACEKLGIRFELHHLPENADLAEVIKTIIRLNNDTRIDAILVQLPLPHHLDETEVISSIEPQKDVDGFHPDTVAALINGTPTIVPGLAAGILALIHHANPALDGVHILIIANSETFALPLIHLANKEGAFAAYAHPDSPDLRQSLAGADIVIIAIGRPNFLKGAMLKPGGVIIDVGTTRVNGVVTGDAHPSVWQTASYVTPVPGGVGPVTVAMLLKNTVTLAHQHKKD